MTYTDEHAVARAKFLAELGIEYSAAFVPQSASRNAKEKPCLNWRVTLSRNGSTIETDYMQGIGHVPGYQTLPRTLYFEPLRKEYDAASETGRYPHEPTSRCASGLVDVKLFYTRKPLPKPELEDVLYCLVSDASAADETFVEWCANFGYDTDSRRAEASYRTCVDIGIRLRRLVGGSAALDKLANLFSGF